ncbi:hypothetical protein DPMN_016949 [Dreissena polymorpha]|uniref:Uncharacterized protein n=1 Tax=Dreissena polymorpha TaxID=45954 RepID=A0A9D4NFR2_DREPO|nr:hypothetical protein DPMN_016949 [Dreissena polymorpha]
MKIEHQIFELSRGINGTNVLTKFHEDLTINVASGFAHLRGTNILVKNVNARVLQTKCGRTDGGQRPILKPHLSNQSHKENCDPPGGHVFVPIGTICELILYIYKTNLFTKFHYDWANNVTSRVFTSFFYYININIRKMPPPGSHVIQLAGSIFELDSCIKEKNVPTKFHKNWNKNVTSRVFTCFSYIHIEKIAPPTGAHVFSPISTIFDLVQDINKTNVLTNFHDDWAKNVTSLEKTAPPTGGHVFQRTGTTFELNQHIIKAIILTKFHDNWAKIEKCQAHWRPFFQRTGTTFELNQHIIKANILTHFELDRDFIGMKLLTKFREDRTINEASRVFTNKCVRTTDTDR